MLLANVIAMWLDGWWLMPIVTDVVVTLCFCGWWKPLVWDNWWNWLWQMEVTCIWLMLLPWWQMELPHFLGWCNNHVADGTATCVTADVIVYCGRWNSHFMEWLMLLPFGRWNSHVGWNISGRCYGLCGRW